MKVEFGMKKWAEGVELVMSAPVASHVLRLLPFCPTQPRSGGITMNDQRFTMKNQSKTEPGMNGGSEFLSAAFSGEKEQEKDFAHWDNLRRVEVN